MIRLKKGLASLFIVVCLVTTINAEWWDNTPPPYSRAGRPMPSSWWEACKTGSHTYGSNPFLIAAVADIEANGWKAGRIGHSRYVGPMGFNRACAIPDDVMFNPEEQIKWACRILAGNPERTLKRYNATWWEGNYIRDVLALKGKMEWEARLMCKNFIGYGTEGK